MIVRRDGGDSERLIETTHRSTTELNLVVSRRFQVQIPAGDGDGLSGLGQHRSEILITGEGGTLIRMFPEAVRPSGLLSSTRLPFAPVGMTNLNWSPPARMVASTASAPSPMVLSKAAKRAEGATSAAAAAWVTRERLWPRKSCTRRAITTSPKAGRERPPCRQDREHCEDSCP